MMKPRFVLLSRLLMLIWLSTPVDGHAKSKVSESGLFLVATTTMVRDMVQAVAGEDARVEGLMGPGVDPHLYKPVASDMAKLRQADAVFYSGLLLEGKMERLFKQMEKRSGHVYAITASLEENDLLKPDEFSGHFDPHVWGDVALWIKCVPVVVKGLAVVAPEKAAVFRKNGEAYIKQLEALDQWAKERAAQVPKANRILITSHDAFNYFGKAYGFRVVAVQGISTVTEAGLGDMVKMVDFIKENKVRAIFVESSVNPAAIKRISEDAGVKVGGSLYSDAMGTPGRMHGNGAEQYDEGTFDGMIRHNVNTVVDALK
ncbi:MAG: manganese/zinc/iron transport system substrate-binding protein [Kiritimatiellia bacterium]|jgi:manganese/zinc/iron transport system substrate-binding protein